MEKFGYKCFTTFWEDFSIADKFGVRAIKDTYRRAFNEWKYDHRYLTELVIVLSWKMWEYYQKENETYTELYKQLYNDTDRFAVENLTEEEIEYYYDKTN